MSNLLQRILVALAGIPVFLALVWLGGWWFHIPIMIVTALCLREFYHLATARNVRPMAVIGVVSSLVLQACAGFLLYQQGGMPSSVVVMALPIAVVFIAIGLLATELWRNVDNALFNVSVTSFGISYVTGGFIALQALRAQPSGMELVMALFASVWLCDSAAYFAGRAFGKHKLFERVSPKKTWEGAVVGAIVAAATFAGMCAWLVPGMPLALSLACGGVVGTLGQLGDLAESLLKRDTGIKDSSHLIPGHGGVFDRFDSMLFSAPLVWLTLLLAGL